MAIWKKEFELGKLNALGQDTLISHLQIEYTEFGDDYLCGTMPVSSITHQPFGLLHGGASVVLAETLGSTAGNLCVPEGKVCVGQEVNANHLRSVKSGLVTGKAKAVYIGGRSQVWNIEITDQAGEMLCCSRLTLAVVSMR